MVLFVDVEMKQPRGNEGKKGRERLWKRASGSAQWEILWNLGWRVEGVDGEKLQD